MCGADQQDLLALILRNQVTLMLAAQAPYMPTEKEWRDLEASIIETEQVLSEQT